MLPAAEERSGVTAARHLPAEIEHAPIHALPPDRFPVIYLTLMPPTLPTLKRGENLRISNYVSIICVRILYVFSVMNTYLFNYYSLFIRITVHNT